MEGFRQGFRFFTQDCSKENCVNDMQRAGYRTAEELYDQIIRASYLTDAPDLDSLLNMCGLTTPTITPPDISKCQGCQKTSIHALKKCPKCGKWLCVDSCTAGGPMVCIECHRTGSSAG